ncbi:MAG: GrpB family protein [Nitrococcus mobilis]|nr:GrpB family protein [Nitrococcus mobilis]
MAHHPSWAALAADACREARRVCGHHLTDLQHVGSTSVPDLPAKPILDLAAAVAALDAIPELARRLTGIGYIYRGNNGDAGGHLFVRESSPGVRTIHLHLVKHNGAQWRNYLLFRDLLRRNPGIRRQYAELKQALGRSFRDDRNSYTAFKRDFIGQVLGDQGAEPRVPGNA